VTEVAVVCFPYAGAGASLYRRWRDRLPARLRLVPVQLPGREERLADPVPSTLHELAQECARTLARLVDGASRYAVLGHSFGAVLAYEVVRAGERAGTPRPSRLIVSGAPAPSRPRPQWTDGGSTPVRVAAELTDDELVARQRAVAGYPDPALDNPDLRGLLLPTLRADLALHEHYRPTAGRPLAVPVTALRGRDDRLVSRADMQAWSAVTDSGFTFEELPGGHLHLVEHPGPFWAAVVRAVQDEAAAQPVTTDTVTTGGADR
jgi:surfactin synthase thioesterase subunit